MLREIRRRIAEDPLLKVGVVAMTFALALTGVAALIVFLDGPPRAVAAKSSGESTRWPLARSAPDTDWWNWDDPSSPGTSPEPGTRSGESGSGTAPEQSRQSLPVDDYDYPLPTDSQLRAANQPRRYDLPPGAIMSLTINALELRNVPVISSDSTEALDQGVIHLPGTSYPWSGHPGEERVSGGTQAGMAGTGSHLVFYRLNELGRGDRITRQGQGRREIRLYGDRELRSRTT